ncbi:alpha-2,8-polysialyltransferase family protein [Sinorhizobium meliloti]|uniref:alpha-2,8-polysialyltransferase family protein n=1 Tax=Rhizobium meliloti TaxID=382 RepID=UPI000B49F582|nr:alpha-2,8-polysialyltransferase family protein [Sinorhizobium meliloti]ASP55462.1 hypothetical protein CDO31_29420 [Sinorhizobium meliloti]
MPGLNPSEKCLFVVAQIGQLRQAQELASSLGLMNVEMAILYTRKNLSMPLMMQAAVNPVLVSTVHKIEIHPASNDISSIAADFALKAYTRLLDQVKPARLFVCSFERHYAILCAEAERRGIPVALFEEGTAILKNAVPGYQSFLPATLRGSAETVYRRVWKNQPITTYVFRPIFIALQQIAALPHLVGKTAWEIYKTPQMQERILKAKHQHFLSGWAKFDRVYSTNPETIARLFPGAEMHENAPRYDNPEEIAKAQTLIAEYGIACNTAIFASQRFDLKPEIQIPVVLGLLLQVARATGYRIVIKLHPRETGAVVSVYRNTIERLGLSRDIALMEGAHIQAEYLAVHSDCPAVVGISSSTLMYAPKEKPSLRSISIGRALLKDFADGGISNVGTEQIRDHVNILSVIPYIEQFDPNAAPQQFLRAAE